MLSRKPVNRRRESGGPKAGATETAGLETNISAAAAIPVPAVPTGDVSHLDQIDLDLEEADILDDGVVGPFVVDHFNVMETDPKVKAMQAQAKAKAMKENKARAKKKKKEDEAKKKKRQLAKDDPKYQQKKEKVLALAKKDAREEFEQEKSDILATVPETIQEMFGQIGFGKWGKQSLPCLILSPYQVPPGPARNIWMQMFEKMQENGRPLEKMSFLVYWYGEEKPSDYYSLIPNNGFTPWEKATKKSQEFAKAAETKRDSDKKLTADDRQKLRGIEQLREDLEKLPEQRVRGDIEFAERDELLSMKDVDELSADNLSDEDEDDVRKKGPAVAVEFENVHQSPLLDSDDAKDSDVDLPEDDEDEEMELGTPVKKPKKKGSATNENGKAAKSKKRNRAAMESNSVSPESPVEEAEQEKPAKSKKKKGGKKKKAEDSVPVAADVEEEVEVERIPKTKRKKAVADDAHLDLDVQPSGKKRRNLDRQQSLGQSGDDAVEGDGDELAAPVRKKVKKKKDRIQAQDDLEAPPDSANDVPAEADPDAVVPKKKGKKAKGRSSLGNGASYHSEQDPVPDEEIMGASDGAILSKKKSKQSVVKTEEEEQIFEEPADDEPVPKKKGKKLKQAVVKEEQIDEEPYEEAPVPKKKGKKSNRAAVKTEEGEEEQIFEEPADEEPVPKKKGKKSKQPVVKTEEGEEEQIEDPADEEPVPKKKGKKSKQPVVKTEEGEEEQIEEEPALDGDDVETAKHIFSKNEDDSEPVLKKWLSAIEKKDTEKINECLGTLLDGLSKLSSRFIEVYNIANYFKETKIVLKQKENDSGIEQLAQLKRSMKEHYQVAKKKFPQFEPDVKYPGLACPAPVKQEVDDGEDGRARSQDSLALDLHSTGASPDIHNTAIVSELSHDIKQEELSQADTKQAAGVPKTLGWTKDPVRLETTDPQRLMGVEFLRQMALQFPEGKVNPDSVAISIERALFDFVGGSIGRMYFDRLHNLVAAVCGDSEPGSLMHKIENGDVKSPKELVTLPNDKLFASFRGEEGETAAS